MADPIDPRDEAAVEAEIADLMRNDALVRAVLDHLPNVRAVVGHDRASRWAIAVIGRAHLDMTEAAARVAALAPLGPVIVPKDGGR